MNKSLFLVGALTSKPYSFSARPWELRSVQVFNFFDDFGILLNLNFRGSDLMRILPFPSVEGEWITDTVRFGYDSFLKQRLLFPMLRSLKSPLLKKVNWIVVFRYFYSYVVQKFFPFSKKLCFDVIIDGNFLGFNCLLSLISLFHKTGLNLFLSPYSENSILTDLRDNYYLLSAGRDLKELKKKKPLNFENRTFFVKKSLSRFFKSSCLFIFSLDLRLEFPSLFLRIKKFLLNKARKIFLYGSHSYMISLPNLIYLGSSKSYFLELSEGRHKSCRFLNNFKKSSSIIVGHSAFNSSNFFFLRLLFSSHLSFLTKRFFFEERKMRIFFPSRDMHLRLVNEIFPFSFSSLSKDISRGDFLFTSCSENFAFRDLSSYSLTIQHASFGNEYTSLANIVLPSFFPLESKDPIVYLDPFGFVHEVSNIMTAASSLSFSSYNNKNFFPIKSNYDIFNYLYTFLFSESLEKNYTFISTSTVILINKFFNTLKPKFFSSTLKFLVFRADLPFVSYKVFFFFCFSFSLINNFWTNSLLSRISVPISLRHMHSKNLPFNF